MTKKEKLHNVLDYLEDLYLDLKDMSAPSDTLNALDNLIVNIELDLREVEE